MTDKHLPDAATAQSAPPVAVLPLDVQKYREHVDDLDLTEEQKVELLRTLWWIMSAFVDLGFSADSVQHVLPAFAQLTSEIRADEVREGHEDCGTRFNEAAQDRDGETNHDP